MTTLKALLWDVDGGLVETARDGHRIAFNLAFASCGLPWCWSERRYGELMAMSCARERLLRDMSERDDAPAGTQARDALARRLQSAKDECYAELLRSGRLPLRAGVAALIEEGLGRGVHMAIATRSRRADVDMLLRSHWGARWRQRFRAVVCAENVVHAKPDPEAYVRVLLQLCVLPQDAVAIEDSPAGAGAAMAADMPVLVTRGSYFGQASFPGAIAVGPGLDRRAGWAPPPDAATCAGRVGRVGLGDIEAWLERAAVPQH